MSAIPWIIISILILLIALAVLAILAFKTRGKKRPIDYYSWFTIGIVWLVVGIPLKNYALSLVGAVFMIISLVHRKEWKKNREANRWENLTKKERKFRLWLMIITLLLGIIVAAGIVFIIVRY